jgi:EF-P beta-lysylation protein EpmB
MIQQINEVQNSEEVLEKLPEKSWQKILTQGVSTVSELLALLDLDELEPGMPDLDLDSVFPLRVPRCFIDRMKKKDWGDPLLRQVLPLKEELQWHPLFTHDPLEEHKYNAIPGLLHKYYGRVLLTVTGACAINCRYCFRRHFPYHANTIGSSAWERIMDYLHDNLSISEVIFSGGDPLLLNDTQIHQRILQISSLPHIKRLRIHTRLPIVLPERITPTLLESLQNSRLQVVLVVHCNHANEMDQSVVNAIFSLRKAGVTLLNQSVLLKGVNDTSEHLIRLSETLFESGILPYYLHLLDKVEGASHFFVEESYAQVLMREISAQLPGYLVPKLVYEKSGEKNKSLLWY